MRKLLNWISSTLLVIPIVLAAPAQFNMLSAIQNFFDSLFKIFSTNITYIPGRESSPLGIILATVIILYVVIHLAVKKLPIFHNTNGHDQNKNKELSFLLAAAITALVIFVIPLPNIIANFVLVAGPLLLGVFITFAAAMFCLLVWYLGIHVNKNATKLQEQWNKSSAWSKSAPTDSPEQRNQRELYKREETSLVALKTKETDLANSITDLKTGLNELKDRLQHTINIQGDQAKQVMRESLKNVIYHLQTKEDITAKAEKEMNEYITNIDLPESFAKLCEGYIERFKNLKLQFNDEFKTASDETKKKIAKEVTILDNDLAVLNDSTIKIRTQYGISQKKMIQARKYIESAIDSIRTEIQNIAINIDNDPFEPNKILLNITNIERAITIIDRNMPALKNHNQTLNSLNETINNSNQAYASEIEQRQTEFNALSNVK